MFSRKARPEPYPRAPLVRAVAGRFRLDQVRVCRTAWQRMRGLIGTEHLASDEGCLLYPCSAVHTFGMAFAVDVIYLSRDKKVVKVVRNLKPWRASSGPGVAYAVLEVRAGVAQRIEVGDTVRFVEGGQ